MARAWRDPPLSLCLNLFFTSRNFLRTSSAFNSTSLPSVLSPSAAAPAPKSISRPMALAASVALLARSLSSISNPEPEPAPGPALPLPLPLAIVSWTCVVDEVLRVDVPESCMGGVCALTRACFSERDCGSEISGRSWPYGGGGEG